MIDLDRLLYWPITSSLDHSTLCNLENPTKHFCFSAGAAQPEAWYGPQAPAGRFQWLLAGFDSAFTDSNSQLHILFHNVHLLPIRSRDLLPLIYTGASLIEGSVKDQYVTYVLICIWTDWDRWIDWLRGKERERYTHLSGTNDRKNACLYIQMFPLHTRTCTDK